MDMTSNVTKKSNHFAASVPARMKKAQDLRFMLTPNQGILDRCTMMCCFFIRSRLNKMHDKTISRMFSSVGGGPLERMTREFKKNGEDAELHAALSPEQWRAFFHRGKIGRLTARALTFGVFPIQTLFNAMRTSFTARPLEKPVLVVSTNPFFLPHILVAAKPIHRCGVAALLYDMYPDAVEAAGFQSRWLSKVMTVANRWMIRHADAAIYIGDVMKKSAETRYGKNPSTWIIPTGASQAEFRENADTEALDPDLREWMKGRVIFSYVGNMGLMHDVETLEKAVPALIQSSSEGMPPIGIVVAATGPGEARLRESWKDLTEHVRFIGPQNDDAWAELLIKTDVAFATLTNQAHSTCVPSKIYSAIAAHCIPLAVAPGDSDLAHFVEKCGFLVRPGDVDSLVNAMQNLAQMLSAQGQEADEIRRAVEEAAQENDIETLCKRWQACFDDVCKVSPEPWKTTLYHIIKRGFDITAASAGLAVIWPVLAATAIAVRHHLGTPILFRQQRPGLDGKPFELLKFRSMANAPEGTDATHDAERLSDFGKKIRALSLDELPTLINVLKGDMSLVGPRPLLMSYIERYNDEQIKRQWAKPGITGWAQVNGRNALSWKEKFEHDVWYVENASCWLDLKILLMTVATVLRRSGIQHENSATMPEFMGNEE